MSSDQNLSRRQFLAGAAGAGLGLSWAGEAAAAVKAVQPAKARASWKAGLARVVITPETPVWMGGYAARKHPCEGKIHDLHAKALALEDPSGARAVLVTADIISFPASASAKIAQQVEQRYGITRDRLLLSASHTHSGPVPFHPYQLSYKSKMSDAQWRDVELYNAGLGEKVVAVIGDALRNLQPARLSFGRGEAGFAVNRRQKTETGYKIGVNPQGPVNHEVPVLRVESAAGKLRGVVCGYACHNTTLGGDNYRICGDYAGFAQLALEKNHPGATAFFVTGCGADQNPSPRGTVAHAAQYGEELAAGVEKALAGRMAPVRGPLRCAYAEVPLALSPTPGRAELEQRLQDKNEVVQRQARELLAMLDRDGRLPTAYPYPLQAWAFGSDLTLVAMSSEVVVDYALRLKKELGAEKLWVAAYCNDVVTYIPSLRVLREGGYEAREAMQAIRLPGPWADSVEETVVGKVHELVNQVRK